MPFSKEHRRPWRPYLVALLIFAAAASVRLLLLDVLGTRAPYLTFFPAVMLAALLGGLPAGFIVTVLSALLTTYCWIEPTGHFAVKDGADWIGLVIFLLSCTMLSWLSELTRRAQGRASVAEAQVKLVCEREQASAALHQCEAKFGSCVENCPHAVFVVNREGRYVHFNPAASALLGYPDDTLAHMHLLEVHPIEEHGAVLRDFETLFEAGRVDVETSLLRADGGLVWVSLRAVRLDDDHAIGYCQDITEVKRAVQEMGERLALRELVASVAATVPGVIYSFRLRPDGSSSIPYASPALEEIYGLEPAEVVEDAAAVFALVHAEDIAALQSSIADSAATMTPWRHEYRVNHPRRGEIWTEGHSVPQREADGGILWHGFMNDVTARKQSEEQIREATRRLELAVKSGGLGVWELDVAANALVWNDRMYELYGSSRAVFDGSRKAWSDMLHPGDRDRALAASEAALSGDRELDVELRVVHPDGAVKTLKTVAVVMRDAEGRALRMTGLSRDVTRQRSLEAQLLQAQKMEAVGRLAGGVAHDFNNNLSVILGYAELSRLIAVNSEQFHDYLDEILKAAEHSRDITQQLLAFSRNEIIAPRQVDLNHLVRQMDNTLSRLIGEDVQLELTTPLGIWPVLIDPAQVKQIVMNLGVNARDAMPEGGTLSIETANSRIDAIYCLSNSDARVGDFVQLRVSDTGVGMDRDTLGHIFEPFYTTKGVGEGTGLGLATVYGIVSQNDGFIKVYSEPEKGSVFALFLPRMAQPGRAEPEPASRVAAGEGSVLLVEDEESVRQMAQLMLERAGYSVLVAGSPGEALEFCREPELRIDCLLTDVIMPLMNGVELSLAVRELRPGIGLVYMSGYTADMIAQHGVLAQDVLFIQKPFGVNSLNEKVQEALRRSRKP